MGIEHGFQKQASHFLLYVSWCATANLILHTMTRVLKVPYVLYFLKHVQLVWQLQDHGMFYNGWKNLWLRIFVLLLAKDSFIFLN